MNKFGLDSNGIRFIDPVNLGDFLQLEYNAKLVLTDSGGVQEEACVLKVPCVTLRDNTERPETLDVGSNVLAGIDPDMIFEGSKAMLKASNDWSNPFGDGNSGKRIVEFLIEEKL